MNAASKSELAVAWQRERDAGCAARVEGQRKREWYHLERAHIASQPLAALHVCTHVAMFGYAVRHHEPRELLGQAVRLLVAGPGSLAGRYPLGNTGGANVGAFKPMPVPDDLAPLFERAGVHAPSR